jgi:hypothetical protein
MAVTVRRRGIAAARAHLDGVKSATDRSFVLPTPHLLLGALACVVAGAVSYYVGNRTESTSDAGTTAPVAELQDGAAPQEPRRLALNTTSDDYDRLVELGYDVFDVGPDESEINSLPEGGQAMVWVGEFTCEEGFGTSFEEFTSLVDQLGDNPRVYGWYLIDEPDPESCPEVVDGIRERADYIDQHAPDQLSYIAITDYEMAPLHPDSSHVDLFGLDPYPCEIADPDACNLAWMDEMMSMTVDAGFPREAIVPVIQVFGQDCATELNKWRLPSEAELQAILDRWETLVPDAPLEVSYSWGQQEEWACPALVDADGTGDLPDLQSVMQAHNAATDPPADGNEAPDA